MDAEVFAGQWKQMHGDEKSWWAKLADDNLDRIGGQKGELIGLLQEKYGYARAHAQDPAELRRAGHDGVSATCGGRWTSL